MYLKYTPLLLGLFLLFASCENKQIDTKGVREELKNRKIRRITEVEILTEADQIGSFTITKLNSIWEEKLKDKASLSHSISKNELDSLLKNDSLRSVASLNFISTKSSNGTELEKSLLDSYSYSAENNLPLAPNIQKAGQEYLLYTSPIILNDKACLSCHGEPGKDNDSETLKKLTAKSGAPVNKKLNDFLGMWSVKIDKKELVKGME